MITIKTQQQLEQLNQWSIRRFTTNSKDIEHGDVFVCREGDNLDSHQFINEAIKRGAIGLIVTKPISQSIPHIITGSFNLSLTLIGHYYDFANQSLCQIGVTGTNGKTTVACGLNQLLNQNVSSAYIGTLGATYAEQYQPLINTTPDAITLMGLFSEMIAAGVTHNVMEISSHALCQDRTSFFDLDIAIITNIGSDHLDYHKSRDNYIQAKLRVIDRVKPAGTVIVNLDDEHCESILARCRHKQVLTFSTQDPNADIYAANIKESATGSQFSLHCNNQQAEVNSKLPFRFNIENMLAIATTLWHQGETFEQIAIKLGELTPPAGRSEQLSLENGATAIIDYAHNHDSLNHVLSDARRYHKGRIITVVGVTGERIEDAADIGKLCSQLSDEVIFTTDNPLGVEQDIIFDALLSMIERDNTHQIHDRASAIRFAVEQTGSEDLLMLCGKGDEQYQYMSANKNSAVPYIGDAQAIKQAQLGQCA